MPMKDKQPEPDLPEAANQKDLEARIQKMLGPEPYGEHNEGQLKVEPKGAPELGTLPDNPIKTAVKTETEETDVPSADAAVDDIVHEESDALLREEDAAIARAFEPEKKLLFRQKVQRFFKAWWKNHTARWATILVAVAGLVTVFTVPTSRYFVLNTVGVRSTASVVVYDQTTRLPLKNVSVSLGGQTGLTDIDGKVSLARVKLGETKLNIEKRAFATIEKPVTVGWGSNPLGDEYLAVVGQQYAFTVKDFLSGKPIVGAEAISGEASALADGDGKILLAVDTSNMDELNVTVTAPAYRDETTTFDADKTDNKDVAMVPARKVLFVSKRSGTYDVYKIDADGKNEELVLKGTGVERDDITLVPHPTDEVAALVSTRENERDADGYLLSTLTLVNIIDGEPTKVAQSERVQIIGWFGDRLVFVKVAAGASASDSKRHRLMSYDYKTQKMKELAAGNAFNDVMAIGDKIYYAPSYTFQPKDKPGFFRVNADGSGLETVEEYEVWNIFRSGYDTLVLSAQNLWSQYNVTDATTSRLNGQPGDLQNHLYVDNQAHTHSLWVDNRDGKGVLLDYDRVTQKDRKIIEESGLTNPVRWLSDATAVFRIRTADETADYVINIEGGEPRKVADVTFTSGVDRWYYY